MVEVLSPSTRRIDQLRKRNDYPRVGVLELWLIDPDGPVALLVRDGEGPGGDVDEVHAGDELRSPLLDGFAVRLGALTER